MGAVVKASAPSSTLAPAPTTSTRRIVSISGLLWNGRSKPVVSQFVSAHAGAGVVIIHPNLEIGMKVEYYYYWKTLNNRFFERLFVVRAFIP